MYFQQYKTIYILYRYIREIGMQKENKKSFNIKNDWMCYGKRKEKSQSVYGQRPVNWRLPALRDSVV